MNGTLRRTSRIIVRGEGKSGIAFGDLTKVMELLCAPVIKDGTLGEFSVPNKHSGATSWTSPQEAESDTAFYNDLAEWCEQLGPTEQRTGFERILDELAEFDSSDQNEQRRVASQWISMLVQSGAFESAAIAMIPPSATFTGGRMKDGTYVAQVILEGSAGAHSRNARSLAMAWLVALLRAFARQAAEARGAATH